jgi:hypothetical protein
MTTKTEWKAALAARGIKVWVSEKVTRIARGVVIDPVVDRVLEYRDASLRLFAEGNAEASYWAARAMEDSAVELDCALAEKTETQAGRKQVEKAKQAAAKKSKTANIKHDQWQAAADRFWSKPQHANKSASAVAALIDVTQANTIRRYIKRPR